MPTTIEIQNASPALSAIRQLRWLTLIRNLDMYLKHPGRFPNLAAKLASLTDAQNQYLNALMDDIDNLGERADRIFGGKYGVDSSDTRTRDYLVMQGLFLLYDTPQRGPYVVVAMPLLGGNVSPRPYCGCALTTCWTCNAQVAVNPIGIVSMTMNCLGQGGC